MTKLSQQDWQWLAHHAQTAFSADRPKPGEPPASKAWKDAEARIMGYLLGKAYPSKPKF